jgi:ribosomal protein S18 acetylase RimI-like enzyme
MAPANSELIIRPAAPHETAVIQTLARNTFRQAYAAYNNPDNLDAYLQEAFSREAIEKALQDLKVIFLLATLNNQAIGYAQLRLNAPDPVEQSSGALSIERFYVDQAFQRRKVGSSLMRQCIAIGRERHAPLLWLCVWKQNPQAIAFYQHHQFQIAGETAFTLGREVQEDYVMRRRLDEE